MIQKKAEGTKKMSDKREIKFGNFTNCIKVSRIENEIKLIEVNNYDIASKNKNKRILRKN